MSIRPLPAELINQIAAGEVVERPASVVKELLENSLDAGATAIDIKMVEGGVKLLRVSDDGGGIPASDLPWALAPHATSKISSLETLENVTTLGFRGEALASIASVSRLTLTSRAATEPHGWTLHAKDGELSPDALERGTVVKVEDLYDNIPARRKFLKGMSTEAGHCEATVVRLALSRPDVAFALQHNQRQIFNLHKGDLNQRVNELFGSQFLHHCRAVDATAGPLRLSGLVALPAHIQGNRNQQYMYVNGRFVRDKLLTHALREAHRDFLHSNRHPAYVLFLELPTEQVDVNVHPSKLEVRFRETQAVHQFAMHAVERILSAPASLPPAPLSPTPHGVRDASTTFPSSSSSATHNFAASPSAAENVSFTFAREGVGRTQLVSDYLHFAGAAATEVKDAAAEASPEPVHRLGHAVGLVHNTYLVAQNSQGLVLVDVHAAHERILYEKLKTQQRDELQTLLIPVVIKLNAVEMATFRDFSPTLLHIGLDVSEAGPTTVMVRALPALLGRQDVELLLRDILADLTKTGDSRKVEEARDVCLASVACRGAIRSGQHLTLVELDSLLREMEVTPRIDQCNHGRPTWVELTSKQLDQFFLRGR